MRRPQHAIGVAAGLSLACTLGGAATASAATTSPPGAATTAGSPVIVILNNQSGSPAGTESPVISQVKAAGGTNVIGYSAVASFAATVTPAEAQSLAANPAVASVVPDQKISVTPVSANQVATAPSGARTGPATISPESRPSTVQMKGLLLAIEIFLVGFRNGKPNIAMLVTLPAPRGG